MFASDVCCSVVRSVGLVHCPHRVPVAAFLGSQCAASHVQVLEQVGACTSRGARPRHMRHHHAVLAAFRPRRRCMQARLRRADIQGAPPSSPSSPGNTSDTASNVRPWPPWARMRTMFWSPRPFANTLGTRNAVHPLRLDLQQFKRKGACGVAPNPQSSSDSHQGHKRHGLVRSTERTEETRGVECGVPDYTGLSAAARQNSINPAPTSVRFWWYSVSVG